ncbi:MAG: hypothetical protein KKE31_08590 [Planctomycetes bacterium]|nr:hypothetical protein [Planctomycetota bacterium]MBU1517642.1 hypothetical protein [Planctomycetota bacterium]MBU2458662.1 hypothetical protein [Planctomycetota bacterium]
MKQFTFKPLTYGDYRNVAKDLIGLRILPILDSFPKEKAGTLEGGLCCFYELLCFGLDLFQNIAMFSRVETPEHDALFFQKENLQFRICTPKSLKIVEINNPFILSMIEFLCCCEYLQPLFVELEKEAPNRSLYKLWPYSPGCIVFCKSGYSVFEATCNLLEETHCFIEQGLMDRYFGLADVPQKNLIFAAGEENLKISPQPVDIIYDWAESCLEYLNKFMPMEVFPNIKLDGEFESIRYRLQAEYNKFKENLSPNKSAQENLTDTERNIIEALGDKTMKGQELLKNAGYDYSSHYKTILSNLVKRGILENIHNKGYKLKQV